MGIDTVDESFASIEEVTHGLMAVVASDLFSHPAPEILNRIEVGTIGRQWDESETEFGGGSLNGLCSMPGGSGPKKGAVHLYDDRTLPPVPTDYSHAPI